MDISIGIPAGLPGATRDLVFEWAQKADNGSFHSLGVIDRVAYPNMEPMAVMAACAAITKRIRLMTTVLVLPLRSAALVAKEAATIDRLSGGRFTLGVGVGRREDDFRAAEASHGDRGKRFERQLDLMQRVWAGQPAVEGDSPIGPPPTQQGGPELLIAGQAAVALRRLGRWGHGFMGASGGDPIKMREYYDIGLQAWQEAGRPGRPRFVGAIYFALGDDAAASREKFIRGYYSFTGPRMEALVSNAPCTPQMVKSVIQGFADVGTDELMFWPTVPQMDQFDRLADIIG